MQRWTQLQSKSADTRDYRLQYRKEGEKACHTSETTEEKEERLGKYGITDRVK